MVGLASPKPAASSTYPANAREPSAQRPWRLDGAEAELPGTPLTREALIPVIERAMAGATPLPQNGFKVTMARNAAVRALLAAGGAL